MSLPSEGGEDRYCSVKGALEFVSREDMICVGAYAGSVGEGLIFSVGVGPVRIVFVAS